MIKLFLKKTIDILAKRYQKQKLILILTLMVAIPVLTINFIISKSDNYFLFLVLNILISLAAGWFLITHVFYNMKQTKTELLFRKKLALYEKKDYQVEIIRAEAKQITLNGIEFYPIYVKLIKDMNKERLFYFLKNFGKPDFKSGDYLKLRVADNIILAFEAENEEI